MKRLLCVIFAFIVFLVPAIASAQAPEGTGADGTAAEEALLPATVVYIVDEQQVEVLGQQVTEQTLELSLSTGERRGEIVRSTSGAGTSATSFRYKVGDRVYLREHVATDGTRTYDMASRDRTLPLAGLCVLFGLVVLAVGRGRGAFSLVALVLSFAVILGYIVPRVAAGQTPMLAALIGCGITMPLTYYLSHGLNRKTTVALLGSLAGLVITGLLAAGALALVGLTGYAGDEASFVAVLYGTTIDLRMLLLAGMIIGVLGVLDDVTVAQSATVEQIAQANRSLDRWQLFRRGMSVGQDHISSMVNTLMLVYAGSSLPLLLLLTNQSLPIGYVLSQELVAEEAVRMLVTSTGLVATVPISTALAAALMATRGRRRAAATRDVDGLTAPADVPAEES